VRHDPGRRLLVVGLVGALAGGCATLVQESIEALMRQGLELLGAGRFDEALGKFREVIGRDPKHGSAYVGMARAFVGKHAWTDALASGRKALELAPGTPEAVTALAEALLGAGLDAFQRGQFAEAGRHLTEYVRLRPADPAGYLQLGRALLAGRSYDAALRAFVDGLGRATDAGSRQALVTAIAEGGTRVLAEGDARAAIAWLREAVRLDPRNVDTYVGLARAYWQSGETLAALDAFRQVLRLDPGHAEALRFLQRGGR
jgi:tetratricopeptide (TPR) repeat protein